MNRYIYILLLLIISCNVDLSSNKGSDFIYINITSETTDKECFINTSYDKKTQSLPYEETYYLSPKDSFMLNLGIELTALESDIDAKIYVNINNKKEYGLNAQLILNEPYRIYLEE